MSESAVPETGESPIPADVEAAIRDLGQSDTPLQAAASLASIANRAVAELNKLARNEANTRRGQPDWGAWASLGNAARDAILKTATCRKVANDLARKAGAS